MGVIQRQGFKRTIVTYSATLLGAIGTLFIYPMAFDAYGEIRFVLSMVAFLYPLLTLGITSLPVRFFPDFSQGEGRNGFLSILLIAFSCALILSGIGVYFFLEYFWGFLNWMNFDITLFQKNKSIIAFLLVVVGLSDLLKRYISNFGRIVIPEIITNTLLKFFLPLLVLAISLQVISPNSFGWILIAVYALMNVLLIIYLGTLGGLEWKVNWKFLTRTRTKEIGGYALYGLIGSLGSVIAFNIDAIMVTGMKDTFANGQYTNALNFAGFLSVPQVAIAAISGPIISKAVFGNRWDEVSDIYKKSSLNLTFIGGTGFILILTNLADLFLISSNPKDMQALWWPVCFLGLAKVIDMMGGTNREIMGYSHLYKYNLGIVLILAVSNGFANYYLIPIYGINGAAVATLISLTLVNLIRGVFLYFSVGIQPFKKQHFFVILVLALLFLIIFNLRLPFWPFFNIIVRSGLTVLVIIGINHRFNMSPLIKSGVIDMIEVVRSRWNKSLKEGE